MEKEKNRLFQRIKQSYKLQILIFVVLSLLVIVLFVILYNVIPVNINYRITDDIVVINDIEQVYIDDNIININGYAFLLDVDSDKSKISILLRNVNDQNEIWANVEQKSRKDISTYFNSNYNYENTGFIATVKEKKLKLDERYEIIIKLDSNTSANGSKTVLTNRYILNGKLYNSYEFEIPLINDESELLRELTSKGKICFYQKDVGMYVYQYDDKLYWIANEKFNFNENGLTYIHCQLFTSDANNLPKERVQYGFDSIGFNFEDYEITKEQIGSIRVASRNIPDEYPITFILTGVYDENKSMWEWSKHFHLYHDFR